MVELPERDREEAEGPTLKRSWSRRLLGLLGASLFWLLLVLGAVLVGAALWIRRTFGPISIDQMIMNVEGGTEAVPDDYITTFVWQAIVVPVALVVAVFLVHWCVRVFLAKYRTPYSRFPNVAVSHSRRWMKVAKPLFAVGAFVTGAAVFVQVVGLDTYLRSMTTSVTMEDYYVVPDTNRALTAVAGQTNATKNLVLIFLESGEEAFSDSSLFGRNLNEPLEDATADWQSFEELQTYQGGGWTMAGLVGTECGVPLRGAGLTANDINSNDIGENDSAYMSNAVCIGDVLAESGYRNVFMGGADAGFASKRDFLESHGYDEILDLNTWQELGESDLSPWGLSDGRLMEHAKEKIAELHESGQPFNLTLLTLDPHEPASMHEYCPIDSEDEAEKLAAAIGCSVGQVADFVQFMNESGYLEDTAVFITGDHPKMLGEGRPFYEELSNREDRRLFNRLWDPSGARIEQSSIDQLSVYPTLLDVLGFGRSDHRAGIGVSALVSTDGFEGAEKSITHLTADQYADLLSSRSTGLYQHLWGQEAIDRTEAQGR